MVNSIPSGHINKFDDWTNSEQNYDKAMNGEQVEDFQMFDFNASSYSSDLKNFAQAYIDKYDGNNDSSMNFSEFVKMCTNGETSGFELGWAKFADSVCSFFGSKSEKYHEKAQMYDLMKTQFGTFNFDGNENKINAGEFASVLYTADLDWDNYSQSGDVVSSLDGNLDYMNYQGLAMITPGIEGYETLRDERKYFHDNFYAQ